jgi:hypothetical protein
MFATRGRQPQIDTQNVAGTGIFELILRTGAFWRKFRQDDVVGQGVPAQIGGIWLNVNIRYITS